MKKTAFILAVLVMLSGLMFVSQAKDNIGSVDIVIPSSPRETEKYAAETLSEYVSAITGYDIPVVKDKGSADYTIYVGDTEKADKSIKSKADGSYVIEPIDDGCLIYGAGNRGTIYGVYGFLYDCCGYRCFTADMGITSITGKLTLPEKKTEYNAYFEYTETDWISPVDEQYSVMNGLCANTYRDIDPVHGGTTGYIGSFCHTLSTQFCSAEKYFEEHPEYFALHGGERVNNQLCLTNPDVLRIVTEEVLDLIKENHDPDASLQIVSLTQNDNMNFCQCEKCAALDDENGSHQGTNLSFANAVADAVKEAGYENIAIDTFAYQYTRNAPSKIVPRDNVIVRICTIECCFSHPLNDESCPLNVSLMNDLENWSKICNRLYIWDYTTNYAYTCSVFPDLDVIQENLQIFAENGVKGVYEEGAYYASSCPFDFVELRAYMLSRLIRDPYCDKDELIDDFCGAYYGDRDGKIKEILSILCKNASLAHVGIYNKPSDIYSLTDEDAKTIDNLWQEAAENANDEQLKNIGQSRLAWEYTKSSLSLGEYGSVFKRKELNKKLYNSLLEGGLEKFYETRVEDGSQIHVNEKAFYLPAQDWQGGAPAFAARPCYTLAALIFGLTCVLALLLFITGIRNKKYLSVTILPVLAGALFVVLWNKNVYISWSCATQFTLSVIALFVIAAYIILVEILQKKQKLLPLLLRFAVLEGVFVALYEVPLQVINLKIYSGRAPNFALSAALLAISVFTFPIVLSTLISARKKKND